MAYPLIKMMTVYTEMCKKWSEFRFCTPTGFLTLTYIKQATSKTQYICEYVHSVTQGTT